MPRFLISLVLLSTLAFPAAAAIVPGPEVEVTQPVVEPAAFDQLFGRIAGDGNQFLAVWVETAAYPHAIHAARLDARGERINDAPLVIAAAGQLPEVIWTGERYFVAWLEKSDLRGRFVETNDTLSEPFTIATNVSADAAVSLATNGDRIVAVWTDYQLNQFFGAFLTVTGEVKIVLNLGPTVGHVNKALVTQANGSFFLVTSRYDPEATPEGEGLWSDIGFRRIREDDPLGERIVVAPATARITSLEVASRTGNALIAWTTFSSASGHTLRSARITALGAGPITTLNIAASHQLQAVVPDASGYLLVYGDEASRRAVRDGSTAPFEIAVPSQISYVAGGAAGAETVLLVRNGFNATSDLFTQRVDSAVFEPVVVAERHQGAPDIADAGGIKLAVWNEFNADKQWSELVAARAGIDRTPFVIAAAGNAYAARVASNGREWLVTWLQSNDIVGVRVSRDGRVLDGSPFYVARFVLYQDRIDIAWDGEAYVVAFIAGFATRFGTNITPGVVRVTSDGVAGEPVPLAAQGPHFGPAVAIGPEGALITWMTGGLLSSRLNGALVTKSGTIVPVSFNSPELLATGTTAVAWNGDTFLVAAPFEPLHFFLVSASGNVTQAPAGATIPVDRVKPTRMELQPLGDRFLLTYAAYGAIHAATINRNGYVADPPVAVAPLARGEYRFGAAGTTLAYARPYDPLRTELTRIFTRELVVAPNAPKRRSAGVPAG
jgi:hypothetical protein